MKSIYIESPTIKALKDSTNEMAWLPLWVSLETGLRVGDVVKLRTSNIKDDGIHYKAQKTKKNGVAKISADLRRKLNKKGKWVFPSPYKKGSHITRQCVWTRIKKACKTAGIDPEGVSPHSLRKVFAVELYRKSGFKAVQDALQHTNGATTEIYSFADWNTGESSELPLKRKDLQLVVRMVLEALGESHKLQPENKKRKGG